MTAALAAEDSVLHVRILRLLWLSATLLIITTCWHVFSLLGETRSKELIAAERDLANLTRVTQEHANRTLRSADQVIRFVQSRYLELGDRLNLAELTARGVIDTEIFNQVGVIDAQGIYVLSNLPINGRLDLSDREHFKVHVPADTGQMFVSKPLLGRASGKWSIQLTRRITRANGDFAGVVVVSIDPGYFTRFYGELNLGSYGLSALYGLDGIARARKVGNKEEFGANAASSQLFSRAAKGENSGSYTQASKVDGVERMYYYRRIPDYPLVVSAGLDMRDLLANYRVSRNALWLQAGLLSLLILLLAVALTRYLQQNLRAIESARRAKLQIQSSKDQLRVVLNLSPDGFVSFDGERRVREVSPAFVRMTAPGSERLEGMDEQEFSAWLNTICLAEARFVGIGVLRFKADRALSGPRELIEIVGPQKRVLQVDYRASKSLGVSQILYFRDVTHEVEVDQMKSEFLATAAHELRTPMASVFGFAEVLLTQQLDEQVQKESLQIIYEQSQLMANVLNELLDLARIEARRGKDFRYAGVCLQDLVRQVVKGFKLPPGRDEPQLLLPALQLHVLADAGKLQQALLNVLSNAYKYSPQGGAVTLELCAETGGTDRLCISVTDRGIGMTEAQLGRVFERFYRADSSGKFPGTGLGMSIAKEIIELHHGAIAISSSPAQGTCVSLYLPRNAALAQSDAALPAGAAAKTTESTP